MVQMSFVLAGSRSARAREAAKRFAGDTRPARAARRDDGAVRRGLLVLRRLRPLRSTRSTCRNRRRRALGPTRSRARRLSTASRRGSAAKIVVVGACTGCDAHTVGIDAILNYKGFAGDEGLESYKGLRRIQPRRAGRERRARGARARAARRRDPREPSHHAAKLPQGERARRSIELAHETRMARQASSSSRWSAHRPRSPSSSASTPASGPGRSPPTSRRSSSTAFAEARREDFPAYYFFWRFFWCVCVRASDEHRMHGRSCRRNRRQRDRFVIGQSDLRRDHRDHRRDLFGDTPRNVDRHELLVQRRLRTRGHVRSRGVGAEQNERDANGHRRHGWRPAMSCRNRSRSKM